MRWTQDGRILLPGSPPQRVPFPFNIGLETTVGALDYRELPGGVAAEIDVLASEILLDLWRRRRMRSYAQLGVGPRYSIRLADLSAEDPSAPLAVAHIVAPFTGGSLAFHHESADGHHAFDATGRASYRLRVEQGWSAFAEIRIGYEAILFAINDMPMSTYLEAGYGYRGDVAPGRHEHELHGVAGLRVAVPLDGSAPSRHQH